MWYNREEDSERSSAGYKQILCKSNMPNNTKTTTETALRAETVGMTNKQPVRLFVELENVLMLMQEGAVEDICKPEWFVHQPENTNMMEAIVSRRLKSLFDVYIVVRAVTTLPNEVDEKFDWLVRKCPTITDDKVILVEPGTYVVDNIPGGVHKADMLLSADDDELVEWRKGGGVSVKVFGAAAKKTKKPWYGKYVCDMSSADCIVDNLAVLQPGIAIVRIADANERMEDVENSDDWILVDEKSCLYMRCIDNQSADGGMYEAYKVIEADGKSCTAHMTINMKDYNDETLMQYMNRFGIQKFEELCDPAYYSTDMSLMRKKMPRYFFNRLAEFVFQTELDNYPDFRRFDSVDKAKKFLNNIIRQAKPVGAA